jgi:Ala-tRNA(Pro) deacylase
VGVTDLTRMLDDAGAQYEVLHHDHTERAIAEAQALGLPPEEVAKTLIVRTPGGHVRALIPASRRIDLRRLREQLGLRKDDVQLATEEEMARDYPEFELGAVPPLGGSQSDQVLLDRGLAERDWLVFAAGSHDDSVRVRRDDFVRLTGAQIVDLCDD